MSDAAGGRAPLVADDGSPLRFAGGVEFLAATRGGGDALGTATGGHALLVVAGGASPCSLDGGASESGGATEVWPLALPCNQTPADRKPRAKSVALFIDVLQTALVEQLIA
ncbi:hypothetical protein JIR23_30120 [Bradyrhizobium diazoefficiens]|nr:hypothetical protein JIR23_30120 [Bradyrhizobium diazoefficiens]